MTTRCLYIHTIGCQMNVYDSGQMAATMQAEGWSVVPGADGADLVVVNTCAVRGKAEQKAFSYLGRLAGLKKQRTGMRIAVSGCVAQQQAERILTRMPFVDLVLGTGAVDRLPDLVRRLEETGGPIVDVRMSERPGDAIGRQPPAGGVSRFVTVMRGCDNFCTYCIVPHVRGRETSRSPDAILEEIRLLVETGVREVTLLGQNVNSYGCKEGLAGFAELLARVNAVKGLLRIRFTTSHPKDLSPDLMRAFRDLDKLCGHIHLPVQSGSNRILARMNRGYTREQYLERVDRLRQIRPGIAISSDFIVGFPGESETDFSDTIDLIRRVRFDGVFAFKYSDRPGAAAARYADKVPAAVRAERLDELLKLQERTTIARNREQVGSRQQVLVEGPSRRRYRSAGIEAGDREQWTGRSAGNRIVHFVADRVCRPGRLVTVKIEKALSHSLWGRTVSDATGRKGERSHAA